MTPPREAVLITGANGELGRALIGRLRGAHRPAIVTLDVRPPHDSIADALEEGVVGDILNRELIDQLYARYSFRQVFHFAALLSTTGERNPELAHRVNVEGTLNLLYALVAQVEEEGRAAGFFYPSSIAVYGVPDVHTKAAAAPVAEDQYLSPRTMYGCNKRYCEMAGAYYAERTNRRLDFRCLRFPGLISAETMPSGGTSDYGPEMLHAAAQGKPYAAFVRPDTTIPFMTMPDGVSALLGLTSAPAEVLTQAVYNVTAFSLSAEEIAARAQAAFPDAAITYAPVEARQRILDSWPARVDDSAARRDWNWQPAYDADAAFDEYLIPAITAHYGKEVES